ncbi:MAG TPA: cyclic nucleotide-binding domain-containing protein [Elusimicrobiota bacterium]|nr:cyclic nucleotide-binding domain-containing protein [Elusimicrobiota bacterium]
MKGKKREAASTGITAGRLKQFSVFQQLDKAVLSQLAKTVVQESYPAGDTIFAEGKWGDSLYLLVEGEVLIRKTVNKKQGIAKTLALLTPGEFFGEMALLENTLRSASAVARRPVVLMRLPRQVFNRLLQKNTKVALQLMQGLVKTFSGRLRQTTAELVSIYELGRVLAHASDEKTLASSLLFQMTQLFDEKVSVGFYRWNMFNMEYDLVSTEGPAPESLPKNVPQRNDLSRWLEETKDCFVAEDWNHDDRFPAAKGTLFVGGRSLLAAPLVGPSGMIGFLLVGHPTRTGYFTSGHQQLVMGMCHLISPAFENSAMRQEEAARHRLSGLKQSML